LFRPRERAFKQFKCPRSQCVKTQHARHSSNWKKNMKMGIQEKNIIA